MIVFALAEDREMKFGAALPITATDDTLTLRDYVQALDGAGFDLLTTSGHVLAVPPGSEPDRPTPTYAGPFHDPFVLFGYLAAITQRVHLRPTILILPLYPTALVAKQAAELQQLSNGRFELGVGLSWNATEYRALNQDFSTRGARVEEQIQVLRMLWSEPFVSFQGTWHTLDNVGLNRLPAQPIPIWMGGTASEKVLRRVARLADGWIPLMDPTEAMPRLRQYVAEAGRDAATFGLTVRLMAGPSGPSAWHQSARNFKQLGATHVTIAAPPELQGMALIERLIDAKQALAAEFGG
jgi:probable F420-dependent oxidoreductase